MRNQALKRLWRRADATLMVMSAVAIASGCISTRWVPLAQAPPLGDTVQVRIGVPSDSTSPATGWMTLYHPRMEGDSVLVGMLVPNDTAMSQRTRVRATSALVGVRHRQEGRTAALWAVALLAVAGSVLFVNWANHYHL